MSGSTAGIGDVRTDPDLCYATHDGVALFGDLYRPPASRPSPVVISIPGGGWRVGSRVELADWSPYLARHGFAVFAIDHRRTTAGKMFPEAVHDVAGAMRFVQRNAEAWGVDPERLILMGSSAGAHLASLAALAGERFDPLAGSPGLPKAAAMVLAYGVYDLVKQWQHGLVLNQPPGEDRQTRFLGATPYDDPDLYHLASPIRHVTYRRNQIKTLLIWGDHDEVVPCSQSLEFLAALQQARFPVTTCPVAGAGHFWFNQEPIGEPGSFSGFTAPRVLRFLQRAFPAKKD